MLPDIETTPDVIGYNWTPSHGTEEHDGAVSKHVDCYYRQMVYMDSSWLSAKRRRRMASNGIHNDIALMRLTAAGITTN